MFFKKSIWNDEGRAQMKCSENSVWWLEFSIHWHEMILDVWRDRVNIKEKKTKCNEPIWWNKVNRGQEFFHIYTKHSLQFTQKLH